MRRVAHVLAVLLPLACSKSTSSDNPAAAPAASKPARPAAAEPVVVDLCAIMTQTDVEAAVGRKSLAAVKTITANLASCSYGDPKQPVVEGHATENLVSAGLLCARDPAEARSAYDMTKSNAGPVEDQAGLGEAAFWDGTSRILNVQKGRFELTVIMGMEAGGKDAARKLVDKTLAHLP